MAPTAHTFSRRVTRNLSLDYWLHLPPDYTRKDSYPLILFLHGSDERGHDLNALRKASLPALAQQGDNFPFIALSPLCPNDSTWPMQRDGLLMLLDAIQRKYAVDPHRIYLTGLSMGGYGVWFLGSEHSERFAAVVPVCGGYDEMLGYPERVCGLRYTPVWAFHGARDRAVPAAETRTMVRVLRRCGGNVKLTVYPRAGHDIWTRVYSNPALYGWMLSHRL